MECRLSYVFLTGCLSQVLAELGDADVAIDQLYFNLHGSFRLEAMCFLRLATCNREDCEPVPPNRPIWHIDESNLYHRLKPLLSDKALRLRLAHDAVAISRTITTT